jgi:hypothetical protein
VKNRTSFLERVFIWSSFFLLLITLPAYAKGPGVKVGTKGKFHPRLYLDGGYDSNVFLRTSESVIRSNPLLSQIFGSGAINIRPGLELDVPTKSVHFKLGGYANYSVYTEPNATNLNQLTGKGDISLHLFPEGIVSFIIEEHFSRNSGDTTTSDDVFNRALFYYQGGASNGGAFLSVNNRASATFLIKPGGKEGAFDIKFGYDFELGLFPDSDIDNMQHNFRLAAKWAFFPKTALLFETNFRLVNFTSLTTGNQSGINRNLSPFKAYLGLLGKFTTKFELRLKVGGGYTLVDETTGGGGLPVDNYGMVIGELDLKFNLTDKMYLRLGARHDFHPSFFGNYYDESVASLTFAANLNRIDLRISADVGYVRFGEVPATLGGVQFRVRSQTTATGNINRNDIVARANLMFDYYITDFFKVGLAGRFEYRYSNLFVFSNPDFFGLGYTKIQVIFRTELAY